MMDNQLFPMRRVRSYVVRDGRMTDAQREAFTTLWPQFGLHLEDGPIDYTSVFKREVPRILEIGFGGGRSLLEMAKLHPEEDYIGIEMHQPGIGALLLGVSANELSNIRIYYADAVEVLQKCIPEKSLDVVQIFFPDPWPKRKHHKRRLIQPEFVQLISTRLKAHGTLHLATDWQHYAEEMMRVLSASKDFVNIAGDGHYAERSSQRPIVTKFEDRGVRSGRQVWELQFSKTKTE